MCTSVKFPLSSPNVNSVELPPKSHQPPEIHENQCILLKLLGEVGRMRPIYQTECLNDDASDHKGELIINKCVYLDPA